MGFCLNAVSNQLILINANGIILFIVVLLFKDWVLCTTGVSPSTAASII